MNYGEYVSIVRGNKLDKLTLALIAHDSKKEDVISLVRAQILFQLAFQPVRWEGPSIE